MPALRHFCLSASRISGVQNLFRTRSAGPVVLFYHGVEENLVDPEVQEVQMALPVFERQIAFLRRQREVISMDDMYESIANGYRLDARQVVLTFDDGYKNNLRIIAPLLHGYSLPFTLFVSTRHISEHRRFPLYYIRAAILYTDKTHIHLRSIQKSFDLSTRETRLFAATAVAASAKIVPLDVVDALTAECVEQLPPERWAELNAKFMSEEPMDWDDVRAVATMGGTVGSHCHDHCILHEKQSPDEIRRQLNESKAAIQSHVGECSYFAYPNGRTSDISASAYGAVRSAQYRMAFSTISGEMTPNVDRFLAPRVDPVPEYEEFCYLLNRSSRQNLFYGVARPRYTETEPAAGPSRRIIVSDLRALYREASHYLTGQVAVLALGFVSFPIFTRVLSVADYGQMALVFQIVTMGVVFSKMGLQQSIQRFYQEYATSSEVEALPKFCSTVFFGAALCTISVTIVFIFGLELIPDSVVAPVLKKVLLIGSGLIFVRGIQPILMNFLRAQRRTKAFTGFDALAKGTTIAFICLLLFTWSRDVKAVLIGTLVVELVSVLVLIVFTLPRGTISLAAFDQPMFRSALAFGLPLALWEQAGVILDSGDRILVQYYLGFQPLGYYSCAYNIANYIALSLMSPLNLALVPIYMKMWESRGPEETKAFLSKALDNFIMTIMCVLAGVAVTAHSAVIVLGSQKLQQAAPLLPVLVLGLMFYALHIFFSAGLVIHKKTITLLKIVVFSAVLNIALNILLIPRIGLQGAAIATLISYVVFLALIVRASLAVMPLRVNVSGCVRYLVAAGTSIVLVSLVQCSSHFLNLIVRGTLSILVYGAMLYGIDRRFRGLFNNMIASLDGLFRKPQQEVQLTSAPTADVCSKI